MKQVFFHTNADFSTIATTPVDGDIAVRTVSGTLKSYAIASPLAVAEDFFIQQIANSGESYRNSQVIKWGSVKGLKVINYAAGAKQVATVTLAAQTAATEYILRITDLTAGQVPFPKLTVNMVGLTAAQACAKLASAINNGRLKDVLSAVDNSTNVVITAKSFDTFFAVEEVADPDAKISIAATTTRTAPVGTLAQAQELEKEMFTAMGTTNFSFLPTLPATEVSGTFDVVVLSVEHPDANDPAINKGSKANEIYLLFKAGNLSTAAVTEAELKTFFGVV